ncbi:MAG: rod shape-determining protein MreC [Nitrospirae bacterium]|nr:rod shape-determining protein MreC [Nitrospirota bacterium]
MSIFRFQRSDGFYKKLFLSIFLILILLTAVSIDLRKSAPSYFQNPVLTIASFLEAGGHSFLQGTQKIWTDYIGLVEVRQKYLKLNHDYDTLKDENNRLKENQLENLRLRQLLNLSPPVPLSLTAAEVIMRDPSNWYQSLTINKGARDGVLPGMGVVSPFGVVGRVLKSGARSAVVQLMTDRNSAVPALISRTRDEGMLEGTERGLARMKYLNVDLKLAVGDQVLTSGLTPAFPKGFLIGNIVRIDQRTDPERRKPADPVPADPFLSVEVMPSVNFLRLEEVMVITSLPDEPPAQDLNKE